MVWPVIGEISSFSNTKPSRSYQRQAFSFSRTQRSQISSGKCCRVKASSVRPMSGPDIPARRTIGRDACWADAAPASPQAARHRRRRRGSSRSRFPSVPARAISQQEVAGRPSPVETQLSIQTRATSSYSSARAGRIGRRHRTDHRTIRHCGGGASMNTTKQKGGLKAALFVSLSVAEIRRDRSGPRSSPWSRPPTKSFANFSLASALA